MEKLNFEQYLYIEVDKLLTDANRIAFGEEISEYATVVRCEKYERKCSMDEINAIVATLSFLTNDKHLCSYTSGNYFGLQVILNGDEIQDFKKENWKVIVSPKLSHRKIAHLTAHEIVPILISLNEHRELWKESENEDASDYFS